LVVVNSLPATQHLDVITDQFTHFPHVSDYLTQTRSRPVYQMCAQLAPSGECIRGYKPRGVDCSCLAPLCGSFLPVLNPVVING